MSLFASLFPSLYPGCSEGGRVRSVGWSGSIRTGPDGTSEQGNQRAAGIESLIGSRASQGLNTCDSAQGHGKQPLTTRRDRISINLRALLAIVTPTLHGCMVPAVVTINLTQCHEPVSATYRAELQGQLIGP